ncbi:ribonuclease H-like domain-containing protein [Tanacetum coccineum]
MSMISINRRESLLYLLKQLLPASFYREDILLLRRRMNRYFWLNPEVNIGLDLWRDVNMLCQSLHSNDVEDFWRTQDEWIVSSWKLYPKSSVHVLDLTNGKTMYMFMDKSYPIRATLLERMLRHRLTQGTSKEVWKKAKWAKGNTIVHPHVSLDEHVAVQRENKARFGGNEESKKMRKTMLKQQFTEFSATEEEGLHKGYDSCHGLKTRGGLESMSFDDLYNKLRSLELDVRIGHSYGVKLLLRPHILLFIELPALAQILIILINRDFMLIMVVLMFLDAPAEFAMMGISPKAYQNAVKTLESQKDWYHKTQMALEEKIRVLSANLENTTNTLSYTEKLHDQAQKEKKEWEVKYEATLARFEKWKESSKNLDKLINSSMSTRTKIGLGFKEYFGENEVFDLSRPSAMYPEPVEQEVNPLYSRFVKAGEMHAVPPSITGTYMPTPYKSDIEKTQVSYGSKSDNKTSETLSESNDFVSCDNSDKSSDSETYASCDSSLKTKTKDFPPAVDIKTLPESDVEDPNSTAGSPSFSCSENVKSPRIICNKSGMNNRNVCKNNYVRVKKCFVCGSKLHLIKDCDFYNCVDSVPCKSKAASVPAGDDGGDPSTDNDIGIVDSGCSRSMTGNKEKLDDFVQVKGGIVKFGGGDGRISGKGTIRTSKLDFENVYYVEELQHFNLFSVSQICDKKNKVLFTDTDCLVLSEEFQLPDESQVVLRIPRERDLYTFSISELQPEQNVTCLVAKASLDESTRWHRRMAHVNFKTINKLAKEGKADEGYLVGYASNSKAYRAYNLTNKRVEETMNLRFLEDKPNVQGIGTQETNINAGTQDTDSDSEVDEQVIVVPSFPSNSFTGPSSSNGPSVMERNADHAEELAKLQRQEYEAKDAAARYGYLFSQETAEILSQAEAEIRNPGISTFWSYEPAGKGNPAVSTSVSADFIPVHADESTLPPGQSLASSENTTRFPVPSDVCKDQLSSGIFTFSSYDDDF